MARAFYGDDRAFIDIRQCPKCGQDHPEMEFKKITTDDGQTAYRTRCQYARETFVLTPAELADAGR